jgi:hypothetical protein
MIPSLLYFYPVLTMVSVIHPSGFVASGSNRAPAPPPALGPMEVAIHKTYETQQTTQNTSTTTTSDRIPREKPAGLGRESDLERGTESQARVP